MKRISKYLASTILAVSFIGCSSTEPTIALNKIELKGIASDDLIVDGIVKAYGANDASKTLLAQGRTDHDDGSYLLDIDYNGVVVVEVTCEDGVSQMLTPGGARVDCAPDLELHSAAAVTPESGSVKVNVSPLTEAVVKRMERLGDSDIKPEHLETASKNIKDMFGVDPIAHSPLEGAYSKIIDSFHALAESSEKTVTDVIDEIAEDLQDGEAGNEDSNLTKALAQVMKEQNLTNGITDNNGTFDPVVNALDFTSDELAGHTFYAVEKADYGRLDFNATEMKWTSMFDETDYDVTPYTIEGAKLRFADGFMIERIVKTADYSVIKPHDEDMNIYLYATEEEAKTKIAQISANFAQKVEDSQSDSNNSHAGFELTSLKTTVNGGELVIDVKTKGDIKDALDSAPATANYANTLHITINNYYAFGLMAQGGNYMQKGADGAVAGYRYHLLPDNKGVELRVPLTSLERIEDVLHSALIVKAEVAEDNENDEHSYDKIETFVTLKTVPLTADMFANKTFYSRWMEQTGPVYEKIQTTTTDINSTEQNGNAITVNNGTYVVANGKVTVTMDDGTTVLSLLDLQADHVDVLYEEESGDKGIDTWYFTKPTGFPGFVPGVGGNHAPEISLAYSPITLAGIPLEMNMVNISDSDQDPLTMGVVTLPSNGTLQINGSDATVGELVDLDTLAGVVYYPTADFNGTVTSEINATDGTESANLAINITVLDKNNTLALTTAMLDGKSFYVMDGNESAKLDFNATHVTATSDTGSESFEYTIRDGKILDADDMHAYLLRIVDTPEKKMWQLGAEYDGGDQAIETWFLTKPAGFPF